MIDADLVGRKALLITRDLAELAPLARKPLAEYLASYRDELVAERLLERMIGRMIDVNYHLLTESGHRRLRITTPRFHTSLGSASTTRSPGGVLRRARDFEIGSSTSTTRSIQPRCTARWARPYPTCPRTCERSTST